MAELPLPLPSGRSCTVYKPVHAAGTASLVPAASPEPLYPSVTSDVVTLTASDGTSLRAYVSRPSTSAQPPCCAVMLADIFGIDIASNRAVADTLAKHGIPTIIPDVFRGNPWPEKPLDSTFAAWLAEHPFDRILSDAAVASEYMAAPSTGLIGFCLGGGRALDEIAKGENSPIQAKAVVSFYGTRIDTQGVGENGSANLLYVFGAADPLVKLDDVHAMRDAIEQKNSGKMKDCEVVIVSDGGHAFVHRAHTDADKEDKESLMLKAIGWLQTYLK